METLDIGEDTGTPVAEDYHVPFKFTGKIEKVVIRLADTKLGGAELNAVEEGRVRIALAE